MATPLTPSLLNALVTEARRKPDGSHVVAVSAPPRWDGSETFATEWGTVRVAPCRSSLAVRDVLTGHTPSEDELLVILTDRDERDLGQEVLARVWKNRLISPSRWEAVRHLFRVDRLDPSLTNETWLVDLLVDVAPVRGYPPPPSGFLDIDTAWRTLLRHALRIDVDQPNAADLLRWGSTEEARSALRGTAGQLQRAIGQRLASVAPNAPHILRLVAQGRGADLVPLGLVAAALWGDRAFDSPKATAARIRFESPLGSKDITTSVARKWGDEANALFSSAVEGHDPGQAHDWADRALALLQDVDAVELARHSDVLPLGFDQRMIDVGALLDEGLHEPGPEAVVRLEQAVDQVGNHIRARYEPDRDRAQRLRMGLRLLRHYQDAPEILAGLGEAARDYALEGAWVDAARRALAQGESVGSLAAAFDRLLQACDTRRNERDLAFAHHLAEWSRVLPSDSAELVPVERVLDELVAPLAKQAPVLLLVMDGLSHPDSIRLLSDLRQAGWSPNRPEAHELPVVVAALPTVTFVSRACLLTGSLRTGNQKVEREGFESHLGMRAAGGVPPRLFHKKDLKVAGSHIAPNVQGAILDPEQRIVGVVVNAVDDHLEKGAQLRLADGLHAIRPLRWLLDAAAEAGRVVVLASDHGHVLEAGSTVRPAAGAGERWRPAEKSPADDEVLIEGPRVLLGEGRIVAPGVERVRYVPIEKRGYHGGATPQEALCPIFVLTTGGTALDGWTHLPRYQPEWWESAVRDEPVVEPLPPRPVVDARGQGLLSLDVTAESEAATDAPWIAEFLASAAFQGQKAVAGRQALDDESTRDFLRVLDARGGVVPPAVLGRELTLSPSRVRTKLEALRRLLNVDGFAVLTIEPDGTARLNRDLLAEQFELET